VLLFDAVIEGMVLADLLEDVESEMVDYVLWFLTEFDVSLPGETPHVFDQELAISDAHLI
jgi:hypothetical protein